MPSDAHVTPKTLVDYHAERLTDVEEQRIEGHLAVCDVCAEASRSVFQLSSRWDRVMTPAMKWTAAAQPSAAAISAENSWLQRLAGTLQGAALVSLEGARLTIKSCARLAADAVAPTSTNIDALLNPNATWSFDLVPSVARGADIEGFVGERSWLPTVVETRSGDEGRLRVAVDRVASRIVVTLDGFPAEPKPLPPLKLIGRNGSTADGAWTATTTREGLRDLRAVFVVTEPDEYVVGTE